MRSHHEGHKALSIDSRNLEALLTSAEQAGKGKAKVNEDEQAVYAVMWQLLFKK